MAKAPAQPRPWLPVPYGPADAAAVRAVAAGTATEDQQRRAMDWIIYKACMLYDMSFFPESSRDSDFAEGRRFVGNQIVKMTKINTAKLVEAEQ